MKTMILFLELVILGNSLVTGWAADRVFRLQETLPVKGMPGLRAVRETPEGPFKPAAYDPRRRGYVVIAESFEAFNQPRQQKMAVPPPKKPASAAAKSNVAIETANALASGRGLTLRQQVDALNSTLPPSQRIAGRRALEYRTPPGAEPVAVVRSTPAQTYRFQWSISRPSVQCPPPAVRPVRPPIRFT